jgi:hypothetical protein
MSAAAHLNTYGVTVDQARSFIMDNINHVDNIFNVARDYGVTCAMLRDIYGNGATYNDVVNFFDSHGLNSNYLIPLSKEWLSENTIYEVWNSTTNVHHLSIHSDFIGGTCSVTTDGNTAHPNTMIFNGNGYKVLAETYSDGIEYYTYLGEALDYDAAIASYDNGSLSAVNQATPDEYLFYTKSGAEAYIASFS